MDTIVPSTAIEVSKRTCCGNMRRVMNHLFPSAREVGDHIARSHVAPLPAEPLSSDYVALSFVVVLCLPYRWSLQRGVLNRILGPKPPVGGLERMAPARKNDR